MSGRDVDGFIAALASAATSNNEEAAMQAAFGLLGEGLKSLSRIADALEHIASNMQQKG